MSKRGYVKIVYTDDSDSIYSHISLTINNTKEQIFKSLKTGDFIKDWFNLKKYLLSNEIDLVVNSSSVDHFIMDNTNTLKSKYLVYKANPELVDYDDLDLDNDVYDELFIPKDSNFTFQDLKNYCKEVN